MTLGVHAALLLVAWAVEDVLDVVSIELEDKSEGLVTSVLETPNGFSIMLERRSEEVEVSILRDGGESRSVRLLAVADAPISLIVETPFGSILEAVLGGSGPMLDISEAELRIALQPSKDALAEALYSELVLLPSADVS